jgi:AdoMet-dependent rRNA methyltransferase SPB1
MYGQYVEARSERDAKFRAKRARGEDADGEWNGFSDNEKEDSDDEELVADSDSSDDEEESQKGLITDLDHETQPINGLTKRAARFFDQDIFKGIDGLEDLEDDSGIDVEDDVELKEESATPAPAPEKDMTIRTTKTSVFDESSDDEDKIEEVERDETQWEQDSMPMKNGRPDIDIITAEAMTLAHQMATGQKTKYDLLDESFNRYSLRDVDGLPDWFLDDENKHSKLQRPTTAAAAAAIKEKVSLG